LKRVLDSGPLYDFCLQLIDWRGVKQNIDWWSYFWFVNSSRKGGHFSFIVIFGFQWLNFVQSSSRHSVILCTSGLLFIEFVLWSWSEDMDKRMVKTWTESERTTPRRIYSSGLEWRHAIRPVESARTTPRWIRSSRLEWRHAIRRSVNKMDRKQADYSSLNLFFGAGVKTCN
jgi:hypothetical protein